MSWLDALVDATKSISKEVVRPGYEHIVKPVSHEIINPVWNQGIAPAMEWSEERGKEWGGDLAYYAALARKQNLIADITGVGSLAGGSSWLDMLPGLGYTSPEDIIAARQAGGSGRAVWEAQQGNRNLVQRGLLDAANPLDPINAVGYATMWAPLKAGFMGASNLGRGMRLAEDASLMRQLTGLGIQGTAKGVWGGLRAPDYIGEQAFRLGSFPLRAPFKYPMGGRNPLPGLLQKGGRALSREAHALWQLARHDQRLGAEGALPAFDLDLNDLNRNVPMPEVDPTPQSPWRQWLTDQSLGIVWQPQRGVTKEGLDDADVEMLANEVARRMETAHAAFSGTEHGAAHYALQAPQQIYDDLVSRHGETIREILPMIFREARTKASVPFPADDFLGMHPLPEVSGAFSAKDVHRFAKEPGARGVRHRLRGTRDAPGLVDVAAAEVAAILRLNRRGGVAASFTQPELPGMIGKVGDDEMGALYNYEQTPERFRQIVDEGIEGPYGLRYADDGGRSLQAMAKKEIEELFGMKIEPEEFKEIWAKGVDLHYSQDLLHAASATGLPSKEWTHYAVDGMGRQEIIDKLGRGTNKRSLTPTDLWGNRNENATAALARTEAGRARLQQMDYDQLSGRPNWTSAQKLGIEPNPEESMPLNREELEELYTYAKDIDRFGERSPDFYTGMGKVAYDLTGDDLRQLDALIAATADTSPNTPVGRNSKLAREEFAKLFTTDRAMMEAAGLTDAQIADVEEFGRSATPFGTHEGLREKSRNRFAHFDGSMLNKLGDSPKVFAFKFSQLIQARKLALRADTTIPEDVREEIVKGIDKTFVDVVTDIWHSGALGYADNPTSAQHIMSNATTRRLAKSLSEKLGTDVATHEIQSAWWFGGKDLSGVAADVVDSMSKIFEDMIDRIKVEKGLDKVSVKDFVVDTLEGHIYGTKATGSMADVRRKMVGDDVYNALESRIKSGAVESEDLFTLTDPGHHMKVDAKGKTVKGKPKSSGLVPETPDEGYGVDVMATRVGDVLDADGKINKAVKGKLSAQVNDMLRRIAPTYDTAWAEQAKIGYHYNKADNAIEAVVHFVIPDPEIARAIATNPKVNQRTIMNYGTKSREVVDAAASGVSKIERAEDMTKLMMAAYSQLPLAKRLVKTPGSVGLAYQQDPVSGAVLKGLDRTMGAVRKSRIGQGYKKLANQMGEGWETLMAAAEPPSAPGLPDVTPFPTSQRQAMTRQVKTQIGADPNLSDQSNQFLTKTFTVGKNAGKSYGEVAQDFVTRAEKAVASLRAKGVSFAADAKPETWKSLVSDPDEKWVLGEAARLKMDPNELDPEKMLGEHMRRLFDEEHGIDPDKLSKLKVFQTAWGQQALMSVRYHTSNITGMWMQTLVGGHPVLGLLNPVPYWRHVMAELGPDARNININTQIGAMKTGETLMEAGYSILPPQLAKTQADLGAAGVSSKNAFGTVASKIVGKRFGGWLGKAADFNSAVAGGVEINGRMSIWNDVFKKEFTAGEVKLRHDITEIARKQGLDPEAILAVPRRGKDGVFHVPTWREDLIKAGLKAGQAEQITRKFLNMRSNAFDTAMKEVNRVHFSYDYTNLDEFVAKIVPFHYWASRATRFYVEETLRHPFYLYKYAQMREGMDQAAEDPRLDARSKGFIKLMDGPYGFSLLMNPESLFGVAKLFDMDSGITPDGETSIGKVIRVMKDHGVGLYPWVDATLNYMGVYGDTFPPDPAGVRTRQLVGAAVNYARAELGMEPAPAPYESANVKLREWISSLQNSLTGGWLGEPVMAKSSEGGTLARASLDDIITSRILAENPGITNQQLLDILNDPDSPEYDQAWQQAAQAGLLNQVLNFTLPTTTKVRESSRDVTSAQVNTIREAAKKAGVRPDEYVPSMADAEFLTTYKNQTGKDWQPGDFDQAQFKRDIARATPGARAFVIQSYEYDTLGGAESQKLLAKANDIRNGRWLPSEFAGQSLDPGTRELVADAWLARNDPGGRVNAARQLQQVYRSTHPEFDEFKSWQGQMFNLADAYGPQGFAYYRDLLSQNNPNAARYFQGVRDDIIRRNPNRPPSLIQAELDGYTYSADAWLAATGRSQTQMQPAPLPTNQFDPATQAVQFAQFQEAQGGGGGYRQPSNWMETLAQYA